MSTINRCRIFVSVRGSLNDVPIHLYLHNKNKRLCSSSQIPCSYILLVPSSSSRYFDFRNKGVILIHFPEPQSGVTIQLTQVPKGTRVPIAVETLIQQINPRLSTCLATQFNSLIESRTGLKLGRNKAAQMKKISIWLFVEACFVLYEKRLKFNLSYLQFGDRSCGRCSSKILYVGVNIRKKKPLLGHFIVLAEPNYKVFYQSQQDCACKLAIRISCLHLAWLVLACNEQH